MTPLEDENEPIEDPQDRFDYCEKVDLHVLDGNPDITSVVSIAAEHGFRGIVVNPSKIEKLINAINKPDFGDKKILPICALDYPFGDSSIGVRNYALHDVKEKGAKGVEIVMPYHLIANKDFNRVSEDARTLINIAKKLDLELKYVIDQNCPTIDDTVATRICRMIQATKIPMVSTSLGYYDSKINHADSVIKMRNIKSKAGCPVKVFITSSDVNDVASYIKAGADLVGLPWNKAVYLVHEYEDLVQKKN